MEQKIACPGCDGQGWIYKVRVPKLGVELFVCEECNSTWTSLAAIGIEKAVNFSDYKEERGLRNQKGLVEIIGVAVRPEEPIRGDDVR